MLDPSVVISKTGDGSPTRHRLSPTTPHLIVDGAPDGARALPVSGAIEYGLVNNEYEVADWQELDDAGIGTDGEHRLALHLAEGDDAVVDIDWASSPEE